MGFVDYYWEEMLIPTTHYCHPQVATGLVKHSLTSTPVSPRTFAHYEIAAYVPPALLGVECELSVRHLLFRDGVMIIMNRRSFEITAPNSFALGRSACLNVPCGASVAVNGILGETSLQPLERTR